jgi:serine/threonine protein phosphatase PrpC
VPVNYLSTAPHSNEEELLPAAITDTGCERDLNEDRYAVIESPSGLAWIVCDGMGGVSGGELAAQLAIEAMKRSFESSPRRTAESAMKSAILEANRIIVLRRQNPAFSSMGTTIVGALFMGSEVAISHVGDSRAYLIRDFSIQQLTHDHTLVQEMVDRGQLNAEEALIHPQAHVLTKCLGSEPGLDIQCRKFWIWETGEGEPNDFLLLCSDGLYSHVSDAEISTVVSKMSPQKACVELVEIAKSRGGFDNITVTIIPLTGQLKREPPVGFDSGRNFSPRSRSELKNIGSNQSWSGVAIISLVLTILSIIFVTAFFFMMM